MRSLPDRLNEQLEQKLLLQNGEKQAHAFSPPAPATPSDPEVEALLQKASRIRSADALRIDPFFARRLEAEMLAHSARQVRRQKIQMGRGNWLFVRPLRIQAAFVVLLFCLVFLVAGTLSVAAQVHDSNNPLYTVKHWELEVQHSLANSAVTRAELDRQMAHEQMHALTSLTRPEQAPAYRQALADMDQHITAMRQAIATLPTGTDRDHLTQELSLLETDGRQTLYTVLPHLTFAERLVTTHELDRLGAPVPRVKSVVMTLSKDEIMIQLSGDHLQAGVRVQIDQMQPGYTGTIQNGMYVFRGRWPDDRYPQTLVVLNPDGTVAQTAAFTVIVLDNSAKNGGNKNSTSTGNGHDNNTSAGHGNGSNTNNGNGHNNNGGGKH